MSKLKSILGLLLAVAALIPAVQAETYVEKKDLPYYEAGWPQTGNLEYLKERCKLDLYYPTEAKGFATIVFFHGGGLIRGSKSLQAPLKEQGVAVVSVNYRLSRQPGTQCPDYIYDAAAATAWTLRHIADYGGDPSLVFVAGHSAGAYLTAMIGLDPRYLAAFGASPAQLAGLFPSSGQMTTHFEVVAERRRRGEASIEPAIDEYAPLAHLKKDTPPIVLVVGDDSREIPGRVGENDMFASLMKYKLKHPDCRYYQLEGFTHGRVFRAGAHLFLDRVREEIAKREAAKKQ